MINKIHKQSVLEKTAFRLYNESLLPGELEPGVIPHERDGVHISEKRYQSIIGSEKSPTKRNVLLSQELDRLIKKHWDKLNEIYGPIK